MNQKLKDEMLKCLSEDRVKKILASKEYYFQKAQDKLNEFEQLDKLGEEMTDKLIEKVNKQKQESTFSHLNLMDEYEKDTNEYRLLFCIGELVSYIDLHSSNKQEFNQYDDKRTIANTYVRQNDWVINLVKYKQSDEIDMLSGIVKNAIQYLKKPDMIIPVLSDKHRSLIRMFLFDNASLLKSFDELITEEMQELQLTLFNDKNRMLAYERILYCDSIKSQWDLKRKIWKISHGNLEAFGKDGRENFLEEKLILVNKDTGRGQGNNFINSMQLGDLFYLCHGNHGIKLIGVVTSGASEHAGLKEGWMSRNYDIIQLSSSSKKYTGPSLGWAPNYNSTCMLVKEKEYNVFEKELLKPFFNMSIEELLKSASGAEFIETSPSEPDSVLADETDEEIYNEKNYILYGPPGTGKTYHSVNYAVAMIRGEEVSEVQCEDYAAVKKQFDEYVENKQILFTTFHQSYTYEDFIEGIKPMLIGDDGNECEEGHNELEYKLEPGVFKDLCDEAKNNPSKKYVLIIDEINRGNISKIFGELITLIESAKRIGEKEGIYVKLPYSKKDFGVPKNIYLLGTMNTADRSIALMDTALRRRFKFIEMMPDTETLTKLNDNKELKIGNIDIKRMIDTMNERIEILYDREHTIGQAYFIDLIRENSIDKLSEIFTCRVIPLLQEYFYDDYDKLRLVLADNQVGNEDQQFITVQELPQNLFGNKRDIEFMSEQKVYSVNREAFSNPLAYEKIYSNVEGE